MVFYGIATATMESDVALPCFGARNGPNGPPDAPRYRIPGLEPSKHPGRLFRIPGNAHPSRECLGSWGRCAKGTAVKKVGEHHFWLVVSNISFIFHFISFHIWDNPSHWLMFFKMVKTTNQILFVESIDHLLYWSFMINYWCSSMFHHTCIPAQQKTISMPYGHPISPSVEGAVLRTAQLRVYAAVHTADYIRRLGSNTHSGWWFGTWLLFFHILGIIFPTDELHFSEGWLNHQPALIGSFFVLSLQRHMYRNIGRYFFWVKKIHRFNLYPKLAGSPSEGCDPSP